MSKEGLSVKVLECDGSPQALAALGELGEWKEA
jgi:hypothetical protein